MKYAVVGSNGFLGSHVIDALRKSYNDEQVHQINRNDTNKYLSCDFDFLINCAGNSKKYLSNINWEKDFSDNVFLAAKLCNELTFDRALHLSSSEVYGTTHKASETDLPNIQSLSNYGFSKLMSEQYFLRHQNNVVVRAAGFLSRRLAKGPVYDLLNNIPLRVSKTSTFQLIDAEQFANICLDLLTSKATGVYNVCGTNHVSIDEIAKTLDIHPSFVEQPQTVATSMLNAKVCSALSITIPNSKDAVVKFSREI